MQEELNLLSQAMIKELIHGEEILWWSFEGVALYLQYHQVHQVLMLTVGGEKSVSSVVKDCNIPCISDRHINMALASYYSKLIKELEETLTQGAEGWWVVATPLLSFLYNLAPSTKQESSYMDLPITIESIEPPTKSEGVKHDSGKLRFSLIPSQVLHALAEVLTFGARRYSPNNWKHLTDAEERYEDAMWRHLVARKSGQKIDPDSGLPHLWHAVTNLAFLIYFDMKTEEERNK